LEVAQASLAISEQIEHRQWLTAAHWQLGVLYLDLLALPEAQQHLEQALALAQEVGSWNWIRIVSGFLAPAHLLQQDLTKAELILTLEENIGVLGAFFYSVSVLYCMTTSLAGHGEGLGTVGLPESKIRELYAEAGFSNVRRVPMENPFNILYEVTP
jgi:hypothetical protein